MLLFYKKVTKKLLSDGAQDRIRELLRVRNQNMIVLF